MEAREDSLYQITHALPLQFDFYHLGYVKMGTENPEALPNDFCAIAFHLVGDFNALMILLFEKKYDSSLYAELGNILASQVATHLNQQQGIKVSISPPQHLTELQFEHLIQNNKKQIRQSYSHIDGSTIIPIETFILPAPREGFGHA